MGREISAGCYENSCSPVGTQRSAMAWYWCIVVARFGGACASLLFSSHISKECNFLSYCLVFFRVEDYEIAVEMHVTDIYRRFELQNTLWALAICHGMASQWCMQITWMEVCFGTPTLKTLIQKYYFPPWLLIKRSISWVLIRVCDPISLQM
jgi:hypothetical protein